MRARGAAFAAVYGLVVLGAFATDANASAYPSARDAVASAVRTFLFMFGPMWGLGVAIANARPTTAPVRGIEIAANGQAAVLAAATFAIARCATWFTVPLEALALVAVAGALGSPTLRTSLDRALVERFAHLSLVGRSLLIAAILGIYAALAPAWVVEAGYVIGPLGFGAWPFVATFAAVGETLFLVLGGLFVGATFAKPAAAPGASALSRSRSIDP